MGKRKYATKKSITVQPSRKDGVKVRQYFSTEYGQTTVWPGFQALYQDQKLFDTTLIAEGQSFKVHRCYMASCSQYFCSMFSGGFTESSDSEINIEGVTAQGLQAVIQYMYTGKIELRLENITTILEAASHFQMWTMQAFCEQFLKDELSVDSCLQFLHMSEVFSLECVRADIIKFMLCQFVQIGQKEEFLTVSAELICELLAENKLEAESELQVLNIALKWLSYEPERCSHAAKVLGCIRFGLMTAEEMELVHTNLMREKSILAQCEDLLHLALKYHMNLFRQPLMNIPMAQPRMYVESLAIFGGKNGEDSLSDLVSAGPVDTKEVVHFETVAKLECPLQSAEIAVFNNFVFVVGGETGVDKGSNYVTGATFRYNTRDGKWLPLASMKHPRTRFALVALSDSLLAVGGCNGGNSTSYYHSVEKYTLKENEWTEMPPFPYSVVNHAGCGHSGCAYISGGLTDDVKRSNQFHKFDVAMGKWEALSPMQQKRSWHCMIGHEDQLFVCAGLTHTQTNDWHHLMTTEMYDVKIGQWSVLAPIPRGIFQIRAACSSNYLFIVGGRIRQGANNPFSDTIQCYDVCRDEWSVLKTKLPSGIAKGDVACVRIPQRFYQYCGPE